MNWTEGSLARHSRGRVRNALIARQKQYFAKVRSGLLNVRPKSGPVAISFFSSNSTSESPRLIPVPQSHDERLSTPPLPSSNRDPPQEHPTYTRNDDHGDLLKNIDKRKRLLEKSDWAGLKLQEPLDISFPGQVYATKRWASVACPREKAPSEPRKHTKVRGEEQYKRLKRSSMRIQIGSQEIQPSIATGSQPSIKHYNLKPERSARLSQNKSRPGNSMHYSERRISRYRGTTSDDSSPRLPTLLGSPELPANVVYSSPVIYEPIPRRIFNPQAQQWLSPSSEDRESMEVEIERPVRPVPSSQESEQQRWKDWILSEESSNIPTNSPVAAMDTPEIHAQDSGSSVITLPSHLQPQLPSLCLSSEPDLAPEQSSPEHSSEHISTEGTGRNHGTRQDDQCLLGYHSPLPSKQQCIPTKKLDIPDDLNDIWRKFACGDDEDSEELLKDAFKEAAHRAAVELHPSDTSSSADEYTETAATCGTEVSPRDHRYKHNDTSLQTSSESSIVMKGTIGSETVFSTITTAGSHDEPRGNHASFILPKPFVGKYVNVEQVQITRAFNVDVSKGGRKGTKGRRKKMTTDGRTDIRSLPDFDGDPIEEIEDD
ncbi:hypothetical protein F5Y12DRAFT_571309 [Xylaria sp. FL1777]|nr:hypothetical protein F5Y12DRAFT_571309 [Xylaria sp. FL1777]